ncbi:hypothetical protein PMAYCL1PPCAC_20117 [Pristionchus mayeri]|uniref:Uncharacterized protein n=1 Tax=Pristionchus mayeri TaxID=1317129 RepID=A0AAN5CSR5_9BILA|nr:hypothetical protein PMAYCL1PPCAC_20117 [Pristionchus mayeri]
MHICARPLNITRRACCQLVAMLNDTGVSPCTPTMIARDDLNGTFSFKYSPPSYLPEPEEIREDHVTFLLGIVILMLIAVTCIFALSKINRPKIALGYGSLSNYGMFMFLPSNSGRTSMSGSARVAGGGPRRRSSFMVLLREIACRRDDTHRNTSSLSILSQMDMSLLPSYQTATATPTSTASAPPPPYFIGHPRRGRRDDEVELPLTAMTSPVSSFHSYAYQEPPPEMTRSV